MSETVIQFGSGNFLRGFFDDFLNILNEKGLYDGKAVIVQPTASETYKKINSQNGVYNLYLRGIEKGREVSVHRKITSVTGAISPYADFDGFLKLSENPDFRFIVSNTTEAGIKYDENDKFSDRPQNSFPGKLTRFLYERYKNKLNGFVILSCELIDNNGKELESCVLKYAESWDLGEGFISFIKNENIFCNTLVDRIVTGYPKDEAEEIIKSLGYEDRLIDTGEIYHLWVIEGDFEKELPLKAAGLNVIWTDDVSPYKKRKVRVLNGCHTSMVFPGLLSGIETVGECLNDGLMRRYIEKCLFGCILPVLGDNEENREFASDVLDRFSNPYIKHQLKSIALNSVSKYTARVLPTVKDYFNLHKTCPKTLVFALAALIEYYKKGEPQDGEYALDFIKNNDTPEILKNSRLWGEDISFLEKETAECLTHIRNDGIREGIKWAVS